MATSYPAARLSPSDPLPDTDDVARYCTPTKYDQENDEPLVTAFFPKGDPLEVSVFRLQHYRVRTELQAVNRIRAEIKSNDLLKLSHEGRFVVLKVSDIEKKAEEVGEKVRVIYTPDFQAGAVSHSSVRPRPSCDRMEFATAMLRLVTRVHTYPGLE